MANDECIFENTLCHSAGVVLDFEVSAPLESSFGFICDVYFKFKVRVIFFEVSFPDFCSVCRVVDEFCESVGILVLHPFVAGNCASIGEL